MPAQKRPCTTSCCGNFYFSHALENVKSRINLPTNYKDSRETEDTSKNFSRRRFYWGRAYFFGVDVLYVFKNATSKMVMQKCTRPQWSLLSKGFLLVFSDRKTLRRSLGKLIGRGSIMDRQSSCSRFGLLHLTVCLFAKILDSNLHTNLRRKI